MRTRDGESSDQANTDTPGEGPSERPALRGVGAARAECGESRERARASRARALARPPRAAPTARGQGERSERAHPGRDSSARREPPAALCFYDALGPRLQHRHGRESGREQVGDAGAPARCDHRLYESRGRERRHQPHEARDHRGDAQPITMVVGTSWSRRRKSQNGAAVSTAVRNTPNPGRQPGMSRRLSSPGLRPGSV